MTTTRGRNFDSYPFFYLFGIITMLLIIINMNKIINYILILPLLLVVVFGLSAGRVFADCSNTSQGDSLTLCNPLENGAQSVKTPQDFIGMVVQAILGVLGSIALAMFVYGGFMMMLGGVNASNVQKGKDTLFWATVGLIVIFSAYAMVKFILGDVLGQKAATSMIEIVHFLA